MLKKGDKVCFEGKCHEIVHELERGVHRDVLVLLDCPDNIDECVREDCPKKCVDCECE